MEVVEKKTKSHHAQFIALSCCDPTITNHTEYLQPSPTAEET